MPKTVTLILCVLAFTIDASAQGAVFVVRHAERADAVAGGAPIMAADPPLSDAGRARAESLAAVLKDAGITQIYVTQYRRTQQTAAPLAAALGLTPVTIDADEMDALLAGITAVKGNTLVVGHSNTVPDILQGLSIATSVTIKDDEYDNLFIVPLQPRAALIRLRYR